MMTDKAPHFIDVHVGMKVRTRRKALGLSQEALANAIDLTFQQVQKYERGFNRISASKLYEIAKALQITVDFFFEGLDTFETSDVSAAEGGTLHFVNSAEGSELASVFTRLTAIERRFVANTVKSLASLSNLKT